MSKHKTREQWINLFKQYEINNQIPKEYFQTLNLKSTKLSNAKRKRDRSYKVKIMQAKCRFINKYKKWKMLDNLFMNNKETRGRIVFRHNN